MVHRRENGPSSLWRFVVFYTVICLSFLRIAACGGSKIEQSRIVNDFLLKQITPCHLHRHIFVWGNDEDKDLGENEFLEERFTPTNVINSLVYYDNITIHTDLRVIVEICQIGSENVYKNPPLFVLKTSDYSRVLKTAELFFMKKLRAKGSLFPHFTKWIIWSNNCTQVSETFRAKHSTLLLDNLAVVCETHSGIEVLTYMWRENRTRRFDKLDYKLAPSVNRCALFPNTLNGLNGRELRVISKADKPFVSVERTAKNSTGNISDFEYSSSYHGFAVDIFNTLAHYLNFTYVMISGDELGWKDLATTVAEGSVDISCSIWSMGWMEQYDVTVTSTFLTGRIIGIYRKSLHHQPPDFFIIFPFEPMAYVFFATATILTAAMYVGIVSLWPLNTALLNFGHHNRHKQQLPQQHKHDHHHKQQQQQQKQQRQHKQISGRQKQDLNDAMLENANNTNDKHNDTQKKCKYPRYMWSKIVQIFTMTCILSVSALQQFYLPSPPYQSARMIIFAWGFAMVMYNALHTGQLVAQYVPPGYTPPFHTFEQMVARTDYRWGKVNGTVLDRFLSHPETGIFIKISERTENIPQLFGTDEHLFDTLKHVIENLDENFVLLSSELLMKLIVSESGRAMEYEFLNDSLLREDRGFIVPRGSEFGLLVDMTTLKLNSMGIFQHIFNIQERELDNTTTDPRQGNPWPNVNPVDRTGSGRQKLTIKDFHGLFIIVFGMLLMSLILLLAEFAYEKAKRKTKAFSSGISMEVFKDTSDIPDDGLSSSNCD